MQWHIAAKEFVPIIIAAHVWGKEWGGHQVIAQCDNMAVVAVINSIYAKDPTLSHMLRCLFFIETQCGFSVRAVHLPGVHNMLADNLSRNELQLFLERMPASEREPTFIPSSLLQWLLHPSMDWTSPRWTALFASTVHKK